MCPECRGMGLHLAGCPLDDAPPVAACAVCGVELYAYEAPYDLEGETVCDENACLAEWVRARYARREFTGGEAPLPGWEEAGDADDDADGG